MASVRSAPDLSKNSALAHASRRRLSGYSKHEGRQCLGLCRLCRLCRLWQASGAEDTSTDTADVRNASTSSSFRLHLTSLLLNTASSPPCMVTRMNFSSSRLAHGISRTRPTFLPYQRQAGAGAQALNFLLVSALRRLLCTFCIQQPRPSILGDVPRAAATRQAVRHLPFRTASL